MKNYRILRVSHLAYPRALDMLFQQHPDLATKSYKEQLEIFFSYAFVYTDSFSRAMRQLGNEAYEVVSDLEWLQKIWAEENSVKYQSQNWQCDIVLAQIQAVKPDMLYFQNYPPMPYDIWRGLKDRFPFIRKIIIHRGYPGNFNEIAAADFLLVGSPRLVKQYEQYGLKPRLLYHYFDESVLEKLVNEDSSHQFEFTFTGSSGYGYGLGHASRYWMLRELLEQTHIQMWLDERLEEKRNGIPGIFALSKSVVRRTLKNGFDTLPLGLLMKLSEVGVFPLKIQNIVTEVLQRKQSPSVDQFELPKQKIPESRLNDDFPDRCHLPVFGLDMYRILQQSKVSLNRHAMRHADAAIDCVGNMRMFQATGVGSCLLTDTGTNMTDLFVPDSEVVTYSSTEECLEKLQYLLEHEDQRREIAAAGQRRTLRDHTALNRCQQIDAWLRAL